MGTATISDQAIVRVSEYNDNYSDVSGVFSIVTPPSAAAEAANTPGRPVLTPVGALHIPEGASYIVDAYCLNGARLGERLLTGPADYRPTAMAKGVLLVRIRPVDERAGPVHGVTLSGWAR
jgi:hypothetical protein